MPWLAPGMTASWRHQGEARRIEMQSSIHQSFSSSSSSSSSAFFFAPCEICFRNLGVVRSSILIFHSAKQNSNDISAKCPTSVSTF